VRGGRTSSSSSVSTIGGNINCGNKNGLFRRHSRSRGWCDNGSGPRFMKVKQKRAFDADAFPCSAGAGKIIVTGG
jgi:hypothetical protein